MTVLDHMGDYGALALVTAAAALLLAWWHGRRPASLQTSDGLTLFPAAAAGLSWHATQLTIFEPWVAYLPAALAVLFVVTCIESRRGPGAALRLIFQVIAAGLLVQGGFGLDALFAPFLHQTLALGSAAPCLNAPDTSKLKDNFAPRLYRRGEQNLQGWQRRTISALWY